MEKKYILLLSSHVAMNHIAYEQAHFGSHGRPRSESGSEVVFCINHSEEQYFHNAINC